jgi:hypothetical protein
VLTNSTTTFTDGTAIVSGRDKNQVAAMAAAAQGAISAAAVEEAAAWAASTPVGVATATKRVAKKPGGTSSFEDQFLISARKTIFSCNVVMCTYKKKT